MKKILLLLAFLGSTGMSVCQDDDAELFEQASEHTIITQIKAFAQEHKWCFAAIAACLGFMYLQQTQQPQRSGSLAEAHAVIDDLEAQIDELQAAIKKFSFLYNVLKPVVGDKLSV